MARNYPADIQMQAALQERYRKENDAQFSWFLRAKTNASLEPKGSKQLEVFRRRFAMAPKVDPDSLRKLPDIQDGNSFSKKVRDPNDALYDNVLKQLETNNQPDSRSVEYNLSGMRPPSHKTQTVLFDGFTREGKGRQLYLRHRYALDPEHKFQYPLLSSMEYGWRLSDYIKKADVKKPPFGRTRLISDTFYTRTGIPMRAEDGQLERAKTIF